MAHKKKKKKKKKTTLTSLKVQIFFAIFYIIVLIISLGIYEANNLQYLPNQSDVFVFFINSILIFSQAHSTLLLTHLQINKQKTIAANHRKDRLIANIYHELRNPLHAILALN